MTNPLEQLPDDSVTSTPLHYLEALKTLGRLQIPGPLSR